MNGHNESTIEEGGTNVYADLGYTNAAEMQRKSQLAGEVTRGQFRGVSEARLLELVARPRHDVKIVISPMRRRASKLELQFA